MMNIRKNKFKPATNKHQRSRLVLSRVNAGVFNCELIPGEGLYVASSGESNSPDMKLDG